MPSRRRLALMFLAASSLASLDASAQIDPDKRQLLQIGYNASFEGRPPLAAYAFYYFNRPQYYRDDLTLRMAVAPVYFDAELGISRALGPNTDVGIGLAGGGFADTYNEVRGGKFIRRESFDGNGGGLSLSLYHLFNPTQRIPLYGVLRGGGYFSTYAVNDETGDRFKVPDDRPSANFRAGLRFGGKEPVLFPSLAMELSLWMESLNRGDSGPYGFNHDRHTHASVQLFYAHAYFAYTLDRGDNFSVSMTAGDSVDADRFSAYRLGGALPLVAEYPLIIPGYFYQEISAERFILFNGRYAYELDAKKRWQLTATAATAVVKYLDGQQQRGNWHSGVGGGLAYKSVSGLWKAGLTYGYGIDAIREGGRGAHVVNFVLQFDLEKCLNNHGSKPLPWDVR